MDPLDRRKYQTCLLLPVAETAPRFKPHAYTTAEAANLQHDRPLAPNFRTKEKYAQIILHHVPTFWSLLYMLHGHRELQVKSKERG